MAGQKVTPFLKGALTMQEAYNGCMQVYEQHGAKDAWSVVVLDYQDITVDIRPVKPYTYIIIYLPLPYVYSSSPHVNGHMIAVFHDGKNVTLFDSAHTDNILMLYPNLVYLSSSFLVKTRHRIQRVNSDTCGNFVVLNFFCIIKALDINDLFAYNHSSVCQYYEDSEATVSLFTFMYRIGEEFDPFNQEHFPNLHNMQTNCTQGS